MTEVDNSLKRLGTDYIDLYITHRWDYGTPIEETMEALHDVVKAGKARYIGASAMFAWQFQKALYVAEKNHWTRFVSMQNHLNLLNREEEREMMPLCRAEKIAVTPYSPLASGRLTRDWSETTKRLETDEVAKTKYDSTADADRAIVERVAELAEKHNVPRVNIAIAWLMQKEPVTAPLIGATKMSHIEDAVAALTKRSKPPRRPTAARVARPGAPLTILTSGVPLANNGCGRESRVGPAAARSIPFIYNLRNVRLSISVSFYLRLKKYPRPEGPNHLIRSNTVNRCGQGW